MAGACPLSNFYTDSYNFMIFKNLVSELCTFNCFIFLQLSAFCGRGNDLFLTIFKIKHSDNAKEQVYHASLIYVNFYYRRSDGQSNNWNPRHLVILFQLVDIYVYCL